MQYFPTILYISCFYSLFITSNWAKVYLGIEKMCTWVITLPSSSEGRIENTAKGGRLFSQKSFIVDIWQRSEYVPNSEYNKVTPRSYYSFSTLLFKLITPWLNGIQNSRTIVNLWQGCDYASASGYVRVLNILEYIIDATASDIFKTLNYLENFLFWHIMVYLGIFNHCSDIFRRVCNSV